jgi:hypothetical protein
MSTRRSILRKDESTLANKQAFPTPEWGKAPESPHHTSHAGIKNAQDEGRTALAAKTLLFVPILMQRRLFDGQALALGISIDPLRTLCGTFLCAENP